VSYLEIANSPGMWIASMIVIPVVLFQVLRIVSIAFARGQETGLERTRLWSAFRTGFLSSIVPSVAILMGLLLLVPRLGLPFSWMRLSVIGSVAYELIAAGNAATARGLEGITSELDAVTFTNVVWTMSLGILFYFVVVAFFTPKIHRLREKLGGTDDRWLKIMTSATFFGAVAYLAAQPIARGGLSLVGLGFGFAGMVLMGALVKLTRQRWLQEWALSVSIIIGMIAVGLSYHWYPGVG